MLAERACNKRVSTAVGSYVMERKSWYTHTRWHCAFVADFYNQRVQELEPDGTFVRQWGTNGDKGYIFAGGFNYPLDVAVAADGTLYTTNLIDNRVEVWQPTNRSQG